MAATARSAIITGPCRLLRSAVSCHTQGPVDITIEKETASITTDAYGKVDERDLDVLVKVNFTPAGYWTSAIRGLLFPYLNPTIGADIFTAADVPLAIHDTNAHIHTIVSSACTKMPSIRLSPRETMFGPCEFTGVRGTGLEWSAADSLYTVATTGGTIADTNNTLEQIKAQVYTGVWGTKTGYTAIVTQDGWTIDWDLGISFIPTDETGSVKAVVSSVSCMAKCVPLATSWANILAGSLVQDTGAARGNSSNAKGADLTITGKDGTTVIVLKTAMLKTTGYKFGTAVIRDGEAAWVATRTFATGVPGAIATMAG